MLDGGPLLLRATLLLGVVWLLAACATPGRQVERESELPIAAVEAYRQAIAAFGERDAQTTLDALGPALAVEPWHVPSHVLRQDALLALGREQEARALYARAAADAPADGDKLLLSARIATGPAPLPSAAEPDGARDVALPPVSTFRVTAYRRALDLAPDSAWPRIALGYGLLELADEAMERARTATRDGFLEVSAALRAKAIEQLEEAESLAQAATRADPQLAAAHELLADVQWIAHRHGARVRRLTEGAAAAQRATTLDPGNGAAHARLARFQRLRSDDRGAARSLETALQLEGDDPRLLAQLGRVLLDLQDDSAALDVLERAVNAQSDEPATWINLGVARFRDGSLELAAQAFTQAAALAPGDPRPHEGLALTRARMGDREGAAAAMQRYLENGGQDRERGADFIDRMDQGPPR